MANIIRRQQGEGMAPRTYAGGRWDPFEAIRDLLRWDPFREMGAMPRSGERTFVPAFDVKETKDAYVFQADLPGIKENDLDVSVQGNRVTISGKREEEARTGDETFYTFERVHGSFTRSFTLPEGIEPEGVQAQLRDGVLSLTVPKKPEVKARKVEVKASKSGEQAKA